jgi:prepilin-type N-terminal cleavage/methylation domain-containing protein
MTAQRMILFQDGPAFIDMNMKGAVASRRVCNSKGFTLIELLLVVTIVGALMSVTIPVSYSMYERYKASASAEKALLLISKIRLESFLYGQENIIVSDRGKLMVNDKPADMPEDMFFQIDSPIQFFRTGATTGGEVKIRLSDYSFVIDIESPFGALTLRTT